MTAQFSNSNCGMALSLAPDTDIIEYMSNHALDAIPKTYDAAVHALAAAHGGVNVEIYAMHDPDEQVVRLVEISPEFPEAGVERHTPSNGMERVVPVFPMGPAKDFPFRSEIVQITPGEWDQLREGKLKLNRNWGELKTARKVGHGD